MPNDCTADGREYADHWDGWYKRDDQRGAGDEKNNRALLAKEWHAPFSSIKAVIAPYLESVRASFPDDAPVLDVGCGSSEICEGLRGEGFSLFSLLDISPDLVAELEEKYRDDAGVECLVGDCRRLPFPDGAFALVVDKGTIDALWGSGDKLAMVRECRRVLRPGGVILSVSFGSVHRIRLYEEHAAELGLEWRMHVLREGDASSGRRLVFVTLLAPPPPPRAADAAAAAAGAGAGAGRGGAEGGEGGVSFGGVPHEPGVLTVECLGRVARTGSLYEEEEEVVGGGVGLDTLFDDSD